MQGGLAVPTCTFTLRASGIKQPANSSGARVFIMANTAILDPVAQPKPLKPRCRTNLVFECASCTWHNAQSDKLLLSSRKSMRGVPVCGRKTQHQEQNPPPHFVSLPYCLVDRQAHYVHTLPCLGSVSMYCQVIHTRAAEPQFYHFVGLFG